MGSPNTPIVLASTSVYRKALMEKLGVDFKQLDPEFEETSIPEETPVDRAVRLALGKSNAAGQILLASGADYSTVVIGSDQVAHCGDQILSKPGSYANAFEQLKISSGQWVTYSTAVCVTSPDGGIMEAFNEDYRLKFRTLSDQMIHHYLELEQPFDCAGSIKAEAHGILLIEDSHGKDINTLYGLPLIQLVTVLKQIGALSP